MNEGALPELPGGWVWTRLDDIAYFQEGPGLLRKQFRDFGIPFLNIRTFMHGRINKSLCQYLDPVEVNSKYKHFLLESGDIVVSSSGSIGKTAIIHKEDLPLMLNTSVIRFRTLSENVLTNGMLYLFLNSKVFMSQIEKLKTGTAQSNFGPTHLRQMVIPLPPLPEQRRIVTKIEELFTKLDAGVSALKKTQAQLKRYRQSVLKAACEGKLVPTEAELACAEGRNYEPADVLLARILKERRSAREKSGAKYKEPAASDTNGLPALPEGWSWITSDAIFWFITSGSRGWARYYSDSGSIFIRVGNLNHDSITLDLKNIQRVQPPVGTEGTSR